MEQSIIPEQSYVLDNFETKCTLLTLGVLLKLAKTRSKVTFIAGRLGKGKCLLFLQIKHCSKKELFFEISNLRPKCKYPYSALMS